MLVQITTITEYPLIQLLYYKPEGTEGATTPEYKVGDTVIYKRGDFVKKDGQKQWDAIKQEDRSNPEAEAVKKMVDEKLIV